MIKECLRLVQTKKENRIGQLLLRAKSGPFEHLYEYVEDIQHHISATASAIYIIKNNDVVGEWYSGFDVKTGQYIQENSRFNVYSVRKSYIGLAAAIAIHEGKIKSLDDYVLTYLDAEEKEALKDIKIRHLVTHTHGLHYENNTFSKEFSPGTEWEYKDAGVILLTKVIKETTGYTVSEILQHNVFNPLQFNETGWESTYNSNLVHDVYEGAQEAALNLKDNTGYERNLYVSARELAHWGFFHLKKGEIQNHKVLPTEILELATRSQTPTSLQNNHQNGFFWFRNDNSYIKSEIGEQVPKNSYQMLGASGCTCLVIPEYEAVAVRMYNKIGNPPGYDYLRDVKNFGNLVSSAIATLN